MYPKVPKITGRLETREIGLFVLTQYDTYPITRGRELSWLAQCTLSPNTTTMSSSRWGLLCMQVLFVDAVRSYTLFRSILLHVQIFAYISLVHRDTLISDSHDNTSYAFPRNNSKGVTYSFYPYRDNNGLLPLCLCIGKGLRFEF